MVALFVAQAPPLKTSVPQPTEQQTQSTKQKRTKVQRKAAPNNAGDKLPSAQPKASPRNARTKSPSAQKKSRSKKPSPRTAPPTCRRIIDELVTALEGPLKPLMDEARLGDKKDLARGATAFRAKLLDAQKRILALRAEATVAESELTDSERTRCEGYGYTAFHRLLTRFSAAAGAYRGTPEILREIGALFRDPVATPATTDTSPQ